MITASPAARRSRTGTWTGGQRGGIAPEVSWRQVAWIQREVRSHGVRDGVVVQGPGIGVVVGQATVYPVPTPAAHRWTLGSELSAQPAPWSTAATWPTAGHVHPHLTRSPVVGCVEVGVAKSDAPRFKGQGAGHLPPDKRQPPADEVAGGCSSGGGVTNGTANAWQQSAPQHSGSGSGGRSAGSSAIRAHRNVR